MSSNTVVGWRPNKMIEQLPWKLDSKTASGIILILGTFSLVGWLYLTQASSVTATSYRIDELRLELDQLKNQNAALAVEIAELQALSQVEARAQALGFGPTNQVRYLAVSNYPVTRETDLSLYGPVSRRYYEVEDNDEQSIVGWWTQTLDVVTAWLADS